MADWVRFPQSQLRGLQGSTTEVVRPESFQAIRTPPVGSDEFADPRHAQIVVLLFACRMSRKGRSR